VQAKRRLHVTIVTTRAAFRLVPREPALLVCEPGACILHVCKLMPAVALVVDDSMLIRYTVCRFLEERGFAVESATNGVEALQILERLHPDLIFTDMQMPKMSGRELITALKKNPETADIPIIIVAGRASGFDEKENRANFAIYKDIDIQAQLEKAVDAVMGKSGGQAVGK
jgi:CheY-like chemotaxis protein